MEAVLYYRSPTSLYAEITVKVLILNELGLF